MDNFFYNEDRHMETLQEYYEESGGYDDTPILFIFNKEGRCYSYEGTESNGYRDEFSVYYAKSMDAELTITHELLHLYGAHDYYQMSLRRTQQLSSVRHMAWSRERNRESI